MKEFLPENLIKLSKACNFPLYVVGGSVRDFLSGFARCRKDFSDWDICAPVSADFFSLQAEKCGFLVRSQYKNTGTVKLSDENGLEYEFTSFRSDEYVRGTHTPIAVYFTEDIRLDAQRRDFTCNAVYYDIQKGVFCDPLGGIEDIKNKRIRTVRESKKVFGEDGLRLMRLARQCGQLGFSVEENTLFGARENAALIRDIAPERIFTELNLILYADQKYGVKDGHYLALKTLEYTGVLAEILPELYLGKGMAQPSLYHCYDVLEHSLRCALYAPPAVRWAALLHDVGKPLRMLQHGNYHQHAEEGAPVASAILKRLKAPKKMTERVFKLVEKHMYDMQGQTQERKLRRFLVENYVLLPDLISLIQADFSACKDDVSVAPTVKRWMNLLEKMRKEGVPFYLKDLKITGVALIEEGVLAPYVGKVLQALLLHCAHTPKDNTKERLVKISKGIYNNLRLNG